MQQLARRFENLPRKNLIAFLLIIFAVVHAIYYGMGVRFDTGQMGWQWQFLDVELLRDHLLQSLYYQHSQPPTFNLLLGLALKIAPHDYGIVLQAVFLICGFVLYVSVVRLMTRLGVARWLAVLVATSFLISPAFLLYEHYLYYTFPLAALLTLSAVMFDLWVQQRKTGPLVVFFVLILLQCTIWAIFHLLYFVLIAGILLAMARSQRRQILMACLVPFLLLFGVYAKNYFVFGQFGVSSWLGMNLARTSVVWLPPEKRILYIETGKLSHASLNNPFTKIGDYEIGETPPPSFQAIPALARPLKSTGDINYNHANYLPVSRQYLRDSLFVMLHQPQVYLMKGIVPAWMIYFTPASNYDRLHNRDKITPVLTFYDYALYGELPFLQIGLYTPYLFLLLSLPVLFFYGLWLGIGKSPLDETLCQDQRRLLLYLCFNILYVAVVGNAVERGENNRFRFITDPASIVIFGLLVQQSWEYLRRERAKRKTPS